MEYKYKPYIISSDFDEKPEQIDESRWIAGAAVDLGDASGPRYADTRSHLLKRMDGILFGNDEQDIKSLGCVFTFFVCSQAFKDKPSDIYKKYAPIMLVQSEYDSSAAADWLQKRVAKIGEVTIDILNDELHHLFECEEWDYQLHTLE